MNVAFAGTKTVYLNPGGWNVDGARYALYMFTDGVGSTWTDFVAVGNGSSLYKAEFDDTYTNMVICRMNGAASGNNFENNNRWAQTGDLDAPFFDGLTYTIDSYTEGNTTLSNNGKNFPAYVYNVGAQGFLTKGAQWGTQAVTTQDGVQADIYYKADGKFSFHTGFGTGYFTQMVMWIVMNLRGLLIQ